MAKIKNLFIYLSGSIKKSTSKAYATHCWTEGHLDEMVSLFKARDINVVFLNPASRSDDLSDELSLFGRDMLQVYLSDAVLADVRERRGIGIGYEIAFANIKGIPVVSWAASGSHYRPREMDMLGQKLKNWRHPFVSQTSKAVVENLEEAAIAISSMDFCHKKIDLTVEDYVTKAIRHYLRSQLTIDKEMQEIISKYAELTTQIAKIN